MTVLRNISFIYVLLLSVLTFIGWASYFEIDETVRARGKIIAEGKIQVIQSPEGGVLQSLEVREGDQVTAGQIVARMESSAAQAAVDEVLSEIETNQIARIRALAELAGEEPDFGALGEEYPDVVTAQLALLEGNRLAEAGELAIIERQYDIAEEQLQRVKALNESGDISFAEVGKAERELIQIEGALQEVREKYRLQARKEIATIEQQISTLSFRLAGRQTALEFATLRAPQDGVVTLLRVNTLGGVLRPGDELMRISPSGEENIVEVQVAPVDVGRLVLGQEVTVQFDSYSSTVYGSLLGRLVYLGADTLTETGQDGRNKTFYVARVSLDPVQENQRIEIARIRPGMEVTVDVKTGTRSVMEYLAKPILRAFSGALTER